MKTYSVLMLSALLTVSAFAQESAFRLIAQKAEVANGSSDVKTYDTKLEKKVLVAKAKAELLKERRAKCGPWKGVDERRAAIAVIEKIEKDSGSGTTAKELRALYDAKQIVAIVGETSNNNIECSLSNFNIYGEDGSVLKLRYDTGD